MTPNREFTREDCVRSMYDEPKDGSKDNIGKIAVISYSNLNPDFREPQYQLVRLLGGFGTTPSGRGNACYGKACNDGEEARWERSDFIGIGNAEVERYAEKLERERDAQQPQGNSEKEME